MARTGRPIGSGKGLFSAKERAELVRLIEGGYGTKMALRAMRVGWERFDATRKASRRFARDVLDAERYKQECLRNLLWRDATFDPEDSKPGDEDIPLLYRYRAREYLLGLGERSEMRRQEAAARRKELEKQDAILQRLKSLEDDRNAGASGRRRRSQPPQQ